MTAAILTSLCILTKPIRDVQSSDGPSSAESALLSALRRNISELQEHMSTSGELKEARELLEEVRGDAAWFCPDTDDPTWSFVQQCLLQLLCLARHLSRLLEDFHQHPASAPTPGTPEAAPRLPPDVLSVAQQKTLSAVLQFVVTLGLCPYLSAGVGVPLGRRSAFGGAVEGVVRRDVAPCVERRLFITTRVLLEASALASLATLIFTRHLGDIMAALCQLSHQPRGRLADSTQSLMPDQRKACREALHDLLNKVHQPIVIKELLVLQGSSAGGQMLPQAPPWLRHLCGQLLSDRLMQPHGVLAVVRAVLEGPGASGASDWRKCDAVAKILASCPQQSVSAESYYSHVCPQVLELLHVKDKLAAQQFQRVATRAALSILQQRPEFAQRFFMGPLLSPLQCCADHTGSDGVEEWELTRCIDDIYKVCVVGNSPSADLLEALADVTPTLFQLFCFTKQNVSHLRSQCQEILTWCLSSAERSPALSLLRRLSGLMGKVGGVGRGFQFSPGSEGGVRLDVREALSDEDEDEALYEKVSGEQWGVQCLVQLMGEMKDTDLPGDFFLLLLQDLTSLAAEQEVLTSSSSLDLEHSGAERRLALLQTLAIMCEGLPHQQLLGKPTQVVGFIVSMLQRACVGLEHGSDGPVESQTLSMGIGLVATLLSGASELGGDGYSSMAALLPPLEQISQQHPDPAIQDLAGDLRAVIATRGAYSPTLHPHRDASDTKQGHASSAGHPTSATSCSSGPHASSRLSSDGLPSKAFSECLLEACDPDVPTRATALRSLTRSLRDRDQEPLQNKDKLLTLFLENVEHEDSFVYLSAIQGLAVLADYFPEQILQRLMGEYQRKPRPLETRLKVGEALMRASRAMGDLAPHYGRPLVGVFLRGARDEDASVRASSLSNLGELCQLLNFSLGPLAQELTMCLTALIKTDREAEVRRAAVHVITLVLRGLGEKTTQVLADVLLELYRALKWVVRSDPDQVAVLHAQLALEELDQVMRKFVFPQQKLEKKIVALP